jgi:predicted HicB family RNase H-like nuclease
MLYKCVNSNFQHKEKIKMAKIPMSKAVNFRVRPELHKLLKKEAKIRNLDVSDLIREAVEIKYKTEVTV